MNRDDDQTVPINPDDRPDPDEEAIPPAPDAPQGVIAGAALAGAPAVAMGQSVEGDWPPTEHTVDDDRSDTDQTE